jgi:hypothetical protein
MKNLASNISCQKIPTVYMPHFALRFCLCCLLANYLAPLQTKQILSKMKDGFILVSGTDTSVFN